MDYSIKEFQNSYRSKVRKVDLKIPIKWKIPQIFQLNGKFGVGNKRLKFIIFKGSVRTFPLYWNIFFITVSLQNV